MRQSNSILAFAISGVALFPWFGVVPVAAQTVPRVWEDAAVGGSEVPLAVPERSPRYMKAAEYYRLPVHKVWKSYPMYRPDKEPAGYMDWLKQQEPQELQLFKAGMSEADWIAAGEAVFDMPISYAAFEPETNHYHLKTFYDDLRIPTDPSGVLPSRRYFIRTKGKIEYGIAHCGMCHIQVLANGVVIKGGQSSLFLERSAGWIGSRSHGDRPQRTVRIWERITANPWMPEVSRSRPLTYEEILAMQWSTPSYVIGREGGLFYHGLKVPDLIGIKDRKYLDATGLGLHRDISDLMRYVIVNQTLQTYARFGDFQPDPPPANLARYSEEQLFALAKFLYDLKPPVNPNAPSDLSRKGKAVFEREGCGSCHTPPFYTANKLTPAANFRIPPEHLKKYDVMPTGVGTDPALALRSRRGTGYYKIPSLRGVWYRQGFGHGGWCESLEDWFDPSRLREDYVPTGFHLGIGAVKGHEFGLRLSADDRSALVAFLRTL
jgi:hypothetical protein